jgi:hypothetical protein
VSKSRLDPIFSRKGKAIKQPNENIEWSKTLKCFGLSIIFAFPTYEVERNILKYSGESQNWYESKSRLDPIFSRKGKAIKQPNENIEWSKLQENTNYLGYPEVLWAFDYFCLSHLRGWKEYPEVLRGKSIFSRKGKAIKQPNENIEWSKLQENTNQPSAIISVSLTLHRVFLDIFPGASN